MFYFNLCYIFRLSLIPEQHSATEEEEDERECIHARSESTSISMDAPSILSSSSGNNNLEERHQNELHSVSVEKPPTGKRYVWQKLAFLTIFAKV